MPAWEAVAGITSAIAGGLQTLINPAAQIWNNERNIAFQQGENTITRQREDTAHVREVADLEKAGLSPLASVNGAQAQEMTAPQGEAPQMDSGALQDSIAVLLDQQRRKEELEESKRQHDENLSHEKELLAEQKRQFDENQELTRQIANMNAKNEIEKFLIEEQRLNNEIEYTQETETRKARIQLSEQSQVTYRELCEAWSYQFKKELYVDYVEYLHAKQKMDTQLSDFIKWFNDPKTIKAGEPNDSASGSGSLSAGLGTSASSAQSQSSNEYYRANQKYYQRKGSTDYSSTGSGSNIGASASAAGSYSKDPKWQRQGQMQKWIEAYCKEKNIKERDFMIVPIYYPREEETGKSSKSYKKAGNWTYLN